MRALVLTLLACLLLPVGSAHADRPARSSARCHLATAPGITASAITIGNAADISGPTPGVDEAVLDAVKAFVAYFDDTHARTGICGRLLTLTAYDSKTDAGADEQAAVSACRHTFALVGSLSDFDSGGAATTQRCGEPDLRAMIRTPERRACRVCFATQADGGHAIHDAVPALLEGHFGGGQHAALLYLNTGANPSRANVTVRAGTRLGLHYAMLQAVDTTEFNYAPYAQAIKDKRIETVQFLGSYQAAVRLEQALQQVGYGPRVFLPDADAYGAEYVESGGSAVDGTVVAIDSRPFAEASRSHELSLYLSWLRRSNPSAEPTIAGVYAWSAARLFTEVAQGLGSRLTRHSLVRELRRVKGWTDHGLHARQPVGAKRLGDCVRFLRLDGGTWKPLEGTAYHCRGTTVVD